jgi:hypothetical protein
MEKNKYRKALLIFGLILTVFLIYLPVIYTNFYHNITGAPEAIKGSGSFIGTVLLYLNLSSFLSPI